MNLPKEIYIVVLEHDGSNDGIPISWETYLDERCTREEAERRAALLRNRYGEVKIGRLVMDYDEIDLSDAMTEEEIERSELF